MADRVVLSAAEPAIKPQDTSLGVAGGNTFAVFSHSDGEQFVARSADKPTGATVPDPIAADVTRVAKASALAEFSGRADLWNSWFGDI
jgi:hypothetical protein